MPSSRALAATTHITLDVAYDAFSTARVNSSSKRCRSASTTARPTIIMYKERGGVRSKSEVTSADRKRINDILNKQLERSSSSTSRAAAAINGKDSSSSSLLAAAKDSRFAFVTAPISKNSNAFDVDSPIPNVDVSLEFVPEMGYDALASTLRGEICVKEKTLFVGAIIVETNSSETIKLVENLR
ncbi:hypothetical protein JHK87_003504 [Glycine soja]|nr:hypothetical protein JHK87_003504 [Glycine soja]